MAWTNPDGLTVKFGKERADASPGGETDDMEGRSIVFDIDIVNGKHTLSDVSEWEAAIPAGAYITAAYLIVTEAFASPATTDTVSVGIAMPDGTVVSATGVINAAARSTLGANAVVKGNGTYVNGTTTVGANDVVPYTSTSATFTAGKGKLVINFIEA